jgi:site-specific recombinase XerD
MEFSAAVEDFLRFCAAERQLSDHTVKAYRSDLADFGKCLPTDLGPDEVSAATLKGYLEEMIGRRQLSAATVRRRFACLRAFFRRLMDLGYVSDPFTGWQLKLPRRRRLPRTLSRSETSSLLSSFRGTVLRNGGRADTVLGTAVSVMISTGVRVGELCRLRIDDVSPEGSTLRVHGKGSRDRIVYIADVDLRRDLRRLVDSRQEANDPTGALFVNRHGFAMKPQSIRSKLRRYATEVGLARRITPHMLRHTAATLLIETGVDIRFVQKLLGHSSIATTEIYTHVSDEALKATLERANVLAVLGSRRGIAV